MTGKEKIEAAFSIDGTPEIPAVICYEGIYIRDRWDELTSCPWWYTEAPDLDLQVQWRSRVIERLGQDWFMLPSSHSKEERESLSVEERPEGVFWIDRRSGREEKLARPRVGGWGRSSVGHSFHPRHLAETPEEVDTLVPVPNASSAEDLKTDGRGDLAEKMLGIFGTDWYPLHGVGSPVWKCYGLWGFEGMMRMIADSPDLVSHAVQRFTELSLQTVREAASLGAAGIWIEECLTDMISPQAYETLGVRFLTEVVDAIRSAGMKSIYYFCGDPAGKWDQILSAGADAVSLEESKKGFAIDIEEVVARVHGRCTVLGNLNAMDLLPNGSEAELRKEIQRQIAAGRRNGSRFIMSVGSPVTPGTSADRVRLYCDMVHELGS